MAEESPNASPHQPLPAPVLPGPVDCSSYLNEFTYTAGNVSLSLFFITTTIFFLHRGNSFIFFPYPEIAYYTYKEVCCFNSIATIIATRVTLRGNIKRLISSPQNSLAFKIVIF